MIVLGIGSGFSKLGPTDFLDRLNEQLNSYNASYPEEKVYVKTDKPFYKPGEDIWFTAFVLNSNTHQATHVSEVVYVDLIDSKGNIASHLELLVQEGTAHGDYTIPSSTPGGLYQLRAYTQWMKNFGDENFFKKEIQIQRIITPRLLLKLEFEREAYGKGDTVNVTLKTEDLRGNGVVTSDIQYKVSLAGAPISASQTQSDYQGIAHISFALPDTLYTHDGLLQVSIRAAGTEESISRAIPIVLNKITLQFFPEGGQLVENVSSNVAFKALNEFGKGADVSGSIVDENNTIVARFESFHMGMGSFMITPKVGKKYYARIERPAGNNVQLELPPPTVSGYVLNLDQKERESVTWSIDAPETGLAYLTGHSHGELFFREKINLRQGMNSLKISTEKFPAGIAVFTLFNKHGIEQCERLVFLNNDNRLNIRIKPDKEYYQPREKVQVQLETTDYNGKPIPAKISLAVVDDQLISFADDKQDNILSAILLSSEVRGEIQEPSFYFEANEPKADKALDYLLMTQGWRRFSWKDVSSNNRFITYTPEKVKNLSGTVVNQQGKGISSQVTLLELGGKKRIVKLLTTPEGHFVFKNIDPTVTLLILAKKSGKIILKRGYPSSFSLNDKDRTIIIPENSSELMGDTGSTQPADVSETESGLNMTLDADAATLNEVVVVGYGSESRRNLAGSVTTIKPGTPINNAYSTNAMEVLSGRVAGLVVTPSSGTSAQTSIVLRGQSSLVLGNFSPLYVIDGHPIETSLNQNFSNGGFIGADEIESIEVLSSPEASAIYGSKAANGVIAITTRSRIGLGYVRTRNRTARYTSVTLTPRKFSPTREFYVPPPASAKSEKREDLRTTVYWNHTVVTNQKGQATVSFYNNDAVSAFRVTAEGFSAAGLIGRHEKVYHTELPLSIDLKLPECIGLEDVLKLPVRINNATPSTRSAKLSFSTSSELLLQPSSEQTITVPPNTTQTCWVELTPKGNTGDFSFSIKLESGDYHDELEYVIRVQPIGFPVRVSFSSKSLNDSVQVSIVDAEKNSIKGELTAFPDLLNDLFTGAEAVLQQPHGCFEQVSSSTFPNILALQFLKQSGLINQPVEKLALSYIQEGYNRLMAYEIKGGGFEWFGAPPAHEGLTAYGLVQFNEMKKVFTKVDDDLLRRTTRWLLSRRNGNGGFLQNTGKYGFSAASEPVTNTYITYALSETGTKDILPEYHRAFNEAMTSKDMYRMALVALAAFNLEESEDYAKLITEFKTHISLTGFKNFKAEHSIVRSYGNSLRVETIALWAVALMKERNPELELINNCIQQIIACRSYGQFGSTQGTTLALKALTDYASLVRTTRDEGEIQLFIDDEMAGKLGYDKDVREKLLLNNFAKNLKQNGNQRLHVLFKGTTNPLPYSVNVQWYTKKPPSSDLCPLQLASSLSGSTVRLNETIRLTATLTNLKDTGLPMSVAVVGIPAGLSVQPWQLKALQEKGVFDFYEITGGNLAIYYRELGPKAKHVVNLDLKAEIPGTYIGAAGSAYVYYYNEHKHWTAGNSIVIE